MENDDRQLWSFATSEVLLMSCCLKQKNDKRVEANQWKRAQVEK